MFLARPALAAYGTSEGVRKAWLSRHRRGGRTAAWGRLLSVHDKLRDDPMRVFDADDQLALQRAVNMQRVRIPALLRLVKEELHWLDGKRLAQAQHDQKYAEDMLAASEDDRAEGRMMGAFMSQDGALMRVHRMIDQFEPDDYRND